ncbi:hypothetical protein GCM10029963_02310 [Micromonospora andamanensis]
MTDLDAKANLHRYLREAREALLGKLDGLSEYDVRRPLVPTGTNLLGLVKHVASVTAGYFGEVFDRPFPESIAGLNEDAEPNTDMWARPTSPATPSSACGTASGRTRTPPSTPCRSTHPARCGGGTTLR